MRQAELWSSRPRSEVTLGLLEVLMAMTTRLAQLADRELLGGDEQFEPGSQETRLHHQGLERLLQHS